MAIGNPKPSASKRKLSPFSSSLGGPDPKSLRANNATSSGNNASGSSSGSGDGKGVRIVESRVPNKSIYDPNEYKVIRLSNGLRVCLISRKHPPAAPQRQRPASQVDRMWWTTPDPFEVLMPQTYPVEPELPSFACSSGNPAVNSRDESGLGGSTSVCIAINVGGLDDPQDAQGLAHFSEHMVHYGSEKFPAEGDATQVAWNFGSGNASTSLFTTQYYNDILDEALCDYLEILADMVTSPSLNVELIKREVHAIDNEFFLRQPYIRKMYLHSHVSYEPVHPLSRFWIGSLESLGKGTQEGSELVQERMRFNIANFYVASAMTVAINSSKPMEELEELVLLHFSNLREGDRKVRHETDLKDSTNHTFNTPSCGKHIFVQGLSRKAELTFLWHLPSDLWLKDKNEKTLEVIDFLFTNTSENGLLSHLKREGFVWKMMLFHRITPYAIVLEINFLLTEKGRTPEGTSTIQSVTCAYLKILQGLEEAEILKIFQQIKVATIREYHYGSHVANLNTTLGCALKLQYVEDSQDILNIDSWQTAKFNFARIKDALGRLNLSNADVIETLPKHASLDEKLGMCKSKTECNLEIKRAPYTGAKFLEVPRKTMIDSYSDFCMCSATFKVPGIYKYLERDVGNLQKRQQANLGGGDMDTSQYLVPPENYGKIKPQYLTYRSKIDHPQGDGIPKIMGAHFGHQPSGLNQFQCVVQFRFVTPRFLAMSPYNYALSKLWAVFVNQDISHYMTEFDLAGFELSVQNSFGVLYVTIKGYPAFMEDVCRKVLAKVFDSPITENMFTLAKEELKNTVEYTIGTSDVLTSQVMATALYAGTDISCDCQEIVNWLTLDHFKSYINLKRKSTRSIVVLAGNIPVKTFKNLAATLDDMNFGPFYDSVMMDYGPIPREDLYGVGESCVRFRNHASCGFTNTVTNIYMLGVKNFYEPDRFYFDMAMKFINQHAFMNLRTKQQLAYQVRVIPLNLGDRRRQIMAFAVMIVATRTKHTVCDLDKRIDEFLAGYGDALYDIPDEIYQRMVDLDYSGTRYERLLTKSEVSEWFKTKFGKDFCTIDRRFRCHIKRIRKVSIQSIGCGNPEAESKICSCDVCTGGIKEWKNGGNREDSSLEFAVGSDSYKHYFVQL